MGPTPWAESLCAIFFEGQVEKIEAQIEIGSIGLARIGPRTIRAWRGRPTLPIFARFIFNFF